MTAARIDTFVDVESCDAATIRAAILKADSVFSSEVDFATNAHADAAKTGPRTVWLGTEVQRVIKSIPRQPDTNWVFWNPRAKKAIKDFAHEWHAIREEAGLSELRIHDLRHRFASHAAMNKETMPMIGKLLGHRELK